MSFLRRYGWFIFVLVFGTLGTLSYYDRLTGPEPRGNWTWFWVRLALWIVLVAYTGWEAFGPRRAANASAQVRDPGSAGSEPANSVPRGDSD